MEKLKQLDIIDEKALRVRSALQEATFARPADMLLLSGGIDSGLLAALDPTVSAATVVLEHEGSDLNHAQQLTDYLGMHWQGIEISEQEAMHNLQEIMLLTQSYDLGLLNDIPVYKGMKVAASLGARTIRTGDFADTLFAGYRYTWEIDDLKTYITSLIPHVTLASDRIAHGMGLRTHYPYTHPRVIDTALTLGKDDNIVSLPFSQVPGDFVETLTPKKEGEEGYIWSKMTLRKAALGLIPLNLVFRTKTDLEFGSGMYKLENYLSQKITPENLDEFTREGKHFWNTAHAGLYALYREAGLKPSKPETSEEYGCAWCGGAVMKGRRHCATCGGYPSNEVPIK